MVALRPWSMGAFSSALEELQWPAPYQKWRPCTYKAVRKAMLASLTPCRDPVVGAQYRWSTNFAPCAPKFWGLIQGTWRCSHYLSGMLWLTHASRVVNCQCLDYQLRWSYCGRCQHHQWPSSIQLPEL